MTIRYITNLTLEEQLSWWDSGNDEEHQLATWLHQHLIDIEDQQSQDIAAIAEEFRQEGFEAGLRAAAEYQEADR